MGRRLVALRIAVATVWGFLTALLVLLAILVTLIGIYVRQGSNSASQKCRSAAAAQLETANIARDNALADSEETVLRLFSASFKRDQAAIDIEGAKLPELFNRIHTTSEAIAKANLDRVASVEACTKG